MSNKNYRFIDNYYGLPSMPCQYRENIVPKKSINERSNKEKCSGLNPDNIYSTLFPEYANPASNYTKLTDRNITSNYKNELYKNDKDLNSCYLDCTENKNCDFFINNKKKNKCFLFEEESMVQNNNIFDKYNKDYNINNFRKSKNNDEKCNLDDNFVKANNNFFPKVNSLDNNLFNIEDKNLTLNECQSLCTSNDKCNSLTFLESKNECSYYKNVKDFNIYDKNSTNLSYDDNIYVKNNINKDSIFDASLNVEKYYKNYNKKGKQGDSFCEFIDNKCKTSYKVGPNNKKELPKQTKKAKSINIPPNNICLPPNCVPKKEKNKNKVGILRINNNINLQCDKNDDNCKQKIYQNSVYSFDNLGYPTDYNVSTNPPNVNNIYSKTYTRIKDYKPNNNIKKMLNSPSSNAYNLNDDCQKWCNNNRDCTAYDYKYNMNGNAVCNYYENNIDDFSGNMNYDKYTTTNIKKHQKNIQNPSKKLLNTPYFSTYTNNELGYDNDILNKKSKKCVKIPSFKEKKERKDRKDRKEKEIIEGFNQIKEEWIKLNKNNYMSNKLPLNLFIFNNNIYAILLNKNIRKFDLNSNTFKIQLTFKVNTNTPFIYSICVLNNIVYGIDFSNLYKYEKNKWVIIKVKNQILEYKSLTLFQNKLYSINQNNNIMYYDETDNIWIELIRNYSVSLVNSYSYSGKLYVIDTNKTSYSCNINKLTNNVTLTINNNYNNIDSAVEYASELYALKTDLTNNINFYKYTETINIDCVNTPNGCCPGTTIPKKELCICDKDPSKSTCSPLLCKQYDGMIYNCSLNELSTGDPLSSYNIIDNNISYTGDKCVNNKCKKGYVCSNGFCLQRNKSFYNSLNYNVNRGYDNPKTGLSMMNFLNNQITPNCQNNKNKKNNNCINNKQCPNIAEPVCGIDNKTYLNACEAKLMGTKVAYPSACTYKENFQNKYNNIYCKNNNKIFVIILLLIIIICIFILTR